MIPTRTFRRAGLLAVALLGTRSLAAQAGGSGFKAVIRTTSYGVPHILAPNPAGAGYGLGYAFAQQDLCTVAERWVTVRGERSKFFGAEGPRETQQQVSNLESDFYWKRILSLDAVGRELRQPAPLGPTRLVRNLVRGYVAGYNRYLAETGVANIPDRRCRGQVWVRPITEQDVYLRAMHWVQFGSALPLIGPMTAAQPPSEKATGPSPAAPAPDEADQPERVTMSNLVALGKDATDNGRGMLFANPHWRWHESERWFEAQLTVPGVMDVYGGTLEGLPVVMFGTNRDVAWTHTASVPRRWTVYQLKPAPGPKPAYWYEGRVRPMTSRTVSVEVLNAEGSINRQSHTYWETHFGPMIANPVYRWTADSAYAVRMVPTGFRWLNQQVGMMTAKSALDLDQAGRKYMALGWLNTAAADRAGRAIYADRSAVPNVTEELLNRCATSGLGKQARAQGGIPVLDGWRKDCEWGTDKDAPLPGIFGGNRLPMLDRTDFVMNSNDSHWANNPAHLLEGFPSIIGDERTPRSLRTRNGLMKLEHRLAGTDGYPGKKFTLDQFEAITMDNKVLSGEIWRDSLVGHCRTLPAGNGFPDACDVLARWDLTDNLDSPGAVLWRRFVEHVSGNSATPPDEFFTIPLDSKDPAHTPRGLNTSNPKVAAALTAAVADLKDSGMPLDAKLRDYQVEERSGLRIPIHGGSIPTGQYNLIISKSGWVPGTGWTTVMHASSYIMWVQFNDHGPVGHTILAPSQSDNPDSPYHADQTVLFSEKKWKPILFDDAAIRADPKLTVTEICGTATGAKCR